MPEWRKAGCAATAGTHCVENEVLKERIGNDSATWQIVHNSEATKGAYYRFQA